MRPAPLRLFAFLLLLAVPVVAQMRHAAAHPPKPETFTLSTFDLEGNSEFSRAEILAASGLHLGEPVTADMLQKATDRVADTGVFAIVKFQFKAIVGGGVILTYNVQDSPQLVPAYCDNCVWLPDDQIQDEVHARLPLFHGKVPLAGNFGDQVRDALQQVLAAHNIHATVEPLAQANFGKLPTAMLYHTTGTAVTLSAIDYTGISAVDRATLDDAVKPLVGTPYRRSVAETSLRERLRNVYLERGYIDVKVADPQLSIVSQSETETRVKLVVPLTEGIRYTYAGMTWVGNTDFTAAQLSQIASFPVGAPINERLYSRLLSTGAFSLYETKGRLDATFDVVPRYQPDGKAVLEVTVHEGEQYHMGSLVLTGLDDTNAARIRAQWKLKPGDVYDGTYPKQFRNVILRAIPPGAYWQWTTREAVDHTAHHVDVVIEFSARAY